MSAENTHIARLQKDLAKAEKEAADLAKKEKAGEEGAEVLLEKANRRVSRLKESLGASAASSAKPAVTSTRDG